MKSGTLVLGMLLAVSLLANAVFLMKLRERPAPRPTPTPVRTVRTEPPPRVAVAAPPSATPAPIPLQPIEAPPPATASPPALLRPAPVSIPSVRNDPQVLGVLEAQEEFGVFWKDIDRVFKARSKFEESKYVQTVLAAVQDFLGMQESARPGFSETVKTAAAGLGHARKEYDAARQTLPPKDKTNPAAHALYQQQKDALDLRYQEQTKAAVDSVRAHLDLRQPRHAELASNLEKLLKNLVPRPTQP